MLNDSSLMPYGKYKGDKMEEVPAKYLLWIYENDKCNKEVKEYIEDNIQVLNKEAGENIFIKDSEIIEKKKVPDCTPIPKKK